MYSGRLWEILPKSNLPGNPPKRNSNRLQKHFESLDLDDIELWTEQQPQSVRDLLMGYQHLYVMNLSELGKISLVQHDVMLDNPTQFKEHYHRISPYQYEEVKKHLKEMIEIGAICKSTSGGLWFCVDLRMLNNRPIKDVQSLPRIEDSLDGATIFTIFDLQSGYWQVELTEASRPLTAFTVGPLWFYECIQMPFGLTNAPATFQCLMESCLVDMHLNWCTI